MRKSLGAFAFISTLCITGQAYADQYGCEVLMCLSNPKGPMAERQCEPPIKKFLDGQAKHPKDPFPSCPEGKPATMEQAYRPYDACPDGTTALGKNATAIQMTSDTFKQLDAIYGKKGNYYSSALDSSLGLTLYAGIGEGDNDIEAYSNKSNKVCVGKAFGTFLFRASPEDQNMIQVTAFDQVATIAPAATPLVYDVKINGKIYNSVRF